MVQNERRKILFSVIEKKKESGLEKISRKCWSGPGPQETVALHCGNFEDCVTEEQPNSHSF